jgi:flagellin-like hook-associated protein FlgL
VDQIVSAINANTSLTGKVKASNDNGKVNIQNLSTEDLSVAGATSGGVINGDTGASNTATVGGNTVRKNLITQFNDLRSQLDKLADDSSFNGVNLLQGDTLKLVFNEINTSSISIVSQNVDGINTAVLGIGTATATEFSSNTSLDSRLDSLSSALTSLRSQASAFGSNLSIVQNRQEFTKAMINTLQIGSDTLVLADSNEEAANLLALQTRQQLSTTALSLASQADQAVLRLF